MTIFFQCCTVYTVHVTISLISHTGSTLTAGSNMEHTPIVTHIIQILVIILLSQLMHILCQGHAYHIISLEFLVRYSMIIAEIVLAI